MLTEALENTLNRHLTRSPRAREICRELAGRRIAVSVRGTGHATVLECAPESLHLHREATEPGEREPDARVSGSPLALLALAGTDPEAVIRRGDVSISGDAEVAQRFRELARLLRPDLEEALSEYVGDAPAHYAARFVRMAIGFGRRAATTGVRNLAEYLSHERGDLVPASEAESFFRDVEAVREDVDRAEARIAELERPSAPPPVEARDGG